MLTFPDYSVQCDGQLELPYDEEDRKKILRGWSRPSNQQAYYRGLLVTKGMRRVDDRTF